MYTRTLQRTLCIFLGQLCNSSIKTFLKNLFSEHPCQWGWVLQRRLGNSVTMCEYGCLVSILLSICLNCPPIGHLITWWTGSARKPVNRSYTHTHFFFFSRFTSVYHCRHPFAEPGKRIKIKIKTEGYICWRCLSHHKMLWGKKKQLYKYKTKYYYCLITGIEPMTFGFVRQA